MQETRPRFGQGNHEELPEWQEATRFAASVARVSAELIVPRDLEWLRYLLARSGGAIAPILAEAWRREFLAEYLLGLYESLDHVLLLEYYLRFLGGGALIPATTVNELDRQRRALQNVIESSAAQLRQTWAETYDDGTLGRAPTPGPLPTC